MTVKADEQGNYPQLEQLKNALETARAHLGVLHNKQAIKHQQDIIRGYEKRIAELTGKDWTNE